MAQPIRLKAPPVELSLEVLLGKQIVGLLDSSGGNPVKLRVQRVRDAVMIDEVEAQPKPRFYVDSYGSSWAVFDSERTGVSRAEQYVCLFKYKGREAADEYAKFLNDKVK